MPQYNTLHHVIPSPTDTPDMVTALDNLSLSNPGVLIAGSTAEANARRSAYMAVAGNEHIVDPPPLMVWRTDTRQLMVESGVGGPWEYLAGRQHGATITFARSSVPENTGPLVLYGTEFIRNSPGWAFSSAQNLVIPQSGMYSMSFSASVSGAAASMGRSFFQFSTTNGTFGNRFPAMNEDNWGGTINWPLSAGNELRVQVFHTGGGARNWSGTLQIAMLNSPNW